MRKTKIVATLGPASDNDVAALYAAGVAVARINCSHLSTEDVGRIVRSTREQNSNIGILVDIQGPKLRLVDGIDASGAEVTLYQHGHGPDDGSVAHVGFDPCAVGIQPGERILVNDGRIVLQALTVDDHMVRAAVLTPGVAQGRRGVNLPDTDVRVTMYSDKDRADIAVAVEAGADWIALSFVQRPEDVIEARSMAGGNVRIMSKIERPQALEVLDEICAVSDGVMAARGDLGVELPFARLPVIQKRIADSAMRAGIVSICATEMLESMITGNRPTRAEVSDVTNAVRDGFDAVMLSAETAIGHAPVATVSAMAAILTEADSVDRVRSPFADHNPDGAAVAAAASALASRLRASAILAVTFTGHNAELVAACRPPVPIIAATTNPLVATRLKIRYGVSTVIAERPASTDEAIARAVEAAKSAGLCQDGDRLVVCLSRTSPRSTTDTIYVYDA
jgi:pyruvate kinase